MKGHEYWSHHIIRVRRQCGLNQGIFQVGQTFGGDIMRCESSVQEIWCIQSLLPTSGKSPMAVSGMAKTVFSVHRNAVLSVNGYSNTTSHNDAIPEGYCGFSHVAIAWLTLYSCRKNSDVCNPGSRRRSIRGASTKNAENVFRVFC